MYLKIGLLVLCALVERTVGFRCYACSFSSVDSDQSCLTITDDTRIVDCPYTFCTILRQELLDPPGVVSSFNRDCADRPAFENHEVSDSTFRTFYRACTTDLCNIGNGIEHVSQGGLFPRPPFEGENLLVPGTGNTSSATKLQITSISVIFMVLLAYLI